MNLESNAATLQSSGQQQQYPTIARTTLIPDSSSELSSGSGGSGGYDSTFLSSTEPASTIEQTTYTGPLCRLRRGINTTYDDYNVPKPFFAKYTCYKCAGYLKLPSEMSTDPDPENSTSMESICNELSYTDMECKRWRQCCQDAVDCCNQQIEGSYLQTTTIRTAAAVPSATSAFLKYCPQVWDGFSCVPKTSPGQIVYIPCPKVIYPDMDPGPFEMFGNKTCTERGEWAMYPERGGEYTFYAPCATGLQEWDRQLNNFKIVCEGISIFTLATSIFCFVYCRQLRSQPPYRVHTQMFLAMLLYTISCLLRDTIVHHFLTTTDSDDSFPPGCEAITILVRLFMITAYSAMSVEAFYLHWNVACAFRPLTRLRILLAIGWAFPLAIIGLYTALRFAFGGDFNDECWAKPWGDFEFIIYGPNFACLALNIIFLISLLFITCRLQTVQRRRNQPCELLKRREFRAMITFTFLFGVPQALVLIRPTSLTGIWFKFYEMTSVALQMLQGAFASVLLCYLNTEVRTVFLRTALGIVLSRERARYESIVSNLSNRVRHSMASFEQRRRSGRRSKVLVVSRASGDSASGTSGAEMTPMMRTPTDSTTSRPTSITYVSNSNHHHHHHQSLSPVPDGGEPLSPDSSLMLYTDGSTNSFSFPVVEKENQRNRAVDSSENGGYIFNNNNMTSNNASELVPLSSNSNDTEPAKEPENVESSKEPDDVTAFSNNNAGLKNE